VHGDQVSEYLGGSVASAGDVNADGHDDVLVGAMWYDGTHVDAGKAFLYLGSAAGLSTTAAWSLEGNEKSAYFGSGVGSAGDVNGDGYDDVIVGASGSNGAEENAGRVFLYLGSASGLSTTAAWSYDGSDEDDYFGQAVAPAGDVDGDGHDDVLVSSESYALLFYGTPGGLSAAGQMVASLDFGYAVGGAGDVDGDGYDDVGVGRPLDGDYSGRAYLHPGSASGLVSHPAWRTQGSGKWQYLGQTVSTAGDVNADGYDDLVVAAPQGFYFEAGVQPFGVPFPDVTRGVVLLYLGSSQGLALTAAWRGTGFDDNDHLGLASLACAGDVDADGHDDVVATGAFYAVLYHGGPAGLGDGCVLGIDATTFWDLVAVGAGDVNGDGASDLLVGTSQDDAGGSNAGAAYLLLGN
jgi:hypothetical protein